MKDSLTQSLEESPWAIQRDLEALGHGCVVVLQAGLAYISKLLFCKLQEKKHPGAKVANSDVFTSHIDYSC